MCSNAKKIESRVRKSKVTKQISIKMKEENNHIDSKDINEESKENIQKNTKKDCKAEM